MVNSSTKYLFLLPTNNKNEFEENKWHNDRNQSEAKESLELTVLLSSHFGNLLTAPLQMSQHKW